MSTKLGKAILILLAVNIVATFALGAYFYIASNDIRSERKRLERKIDDIEPCEDTSQESFAVFGALFMSELEGKVDEITADIEAQIASVEEGLSKYDDDISSISASLEELNEKMENINNVILSLQEILDSIKSFLKID